MFFEEKSDKNWEDPTKNLEESTEMELCFAKRCGSTLVHYGLLALSPPVWYYTPKHIIKIKGGPHRANDETLWRL